MILDLHKPVFLAIYAIMVGIYTILFLKKFETKDYNKFISVSLFMFYILCVVKLTILPIRLTPLEGMTFDFTYYYQIIPFKTIRQVIEHNTWKVQLIGNILLLLPLPVFLQLMSKKTLNSIKLGVVCFGISVTIELTQLTINIFTKFPNKLMDIDDLILNSIGILIGVVIATFVDKKRTVNSDDILESNI